MEPLPDYLQPLEFVTQPFPREAVEAAIERRDESIPHLLGALEWARAQRGLLDDDYILHYFALFLLAEFRESRALRPIVELFRQSVDEDDIIDFTAEQLPAVLASVAGDDLTPLRELIEDSAASQWVRAAGLRALGTLALRGTLPREALTPYVEELFAGRLERQPSHAWNSLVSVCVTLRLTQFLPAIHQAYEDGLADPFFRTLQDLEGEIRRAPPEAIPAHAEISSALVESAIEEMMDWGCFDPFIEAEEPWGPTDGLTTFNDLPADYEALTPYVRPFEKIGRNHPCPCGSGRKYKKCCGATL